MNIRGYYNFVNMRQYLFYNQSKKFFCQAMKILL